MKSEPEVTGIITRKSRITISILLGAVFVSLSIILTGTGFNPLWLLPVVLVALLVALLSAENFLLVTVFLVPLSVQLRFILPGTPIDIFLPTELMLPVILILVVFKTVVTAEIDRKILIHPVTIIALCMLGWSLMTTITSTMFDVSVKNLLMRLWYFAGFYLLAAEVFKRRQTIINYFTAYLAGMVPVVIFFTVKMWQAGVFNQSASYSAIRPFFLDHTALGASLAFCIPLIVFLLFKKGTSAVSRFILLVMLLLFTFAFILSYSRAAWLSLAAAILVAIILALRISWKIIVPGIVIILMILAGSWSSLMLKMNENRQESSADFSKHMQSIANITTDVSNMERLNRWKSALRMSVEKPLFGWGPATYQFKYAPFQMASDKTPISTNWGEGGNAHSEYLSALVDSGIPGMALYIGLIVIFISRGIFLFRTIEDRQSAFLVLTLITCLVTYIVHGGLNNFLDSDKISALFWGMIAAIVALDIESGKEHKLPSQ